MKKSVERPGRLYYIDWVKVLAMFCVFFFHNARFYDVFSDWHVRNATTSFGASALVAFLSQWGMPLFFLISGTSTYYALKSRRVMEFIRDRSLRLLIPLIFGMLIINVPQAYFEALSHGEVLRGNFFQLYVLYLKKLPDLPLYHLWFLEYLFIISIVTLPFFIARKGGSSAVARIAGLFDRGIILILLLVLCLAAINAFIFPGGYWGNRGQGGWNIVTYLLFYISGCLLFANVRIMQTVGKLCWILLGTAVIASACLFVFFTNTLMDLAGNFGTGAYILAHFVQAVNTWCWMLAILGMGRRFLNFNNRFLSYAGEAVLPFYILHQTIIISIGYYVVQWSVGIGLKYLTISTTSFIAIMAVYELLVRRINVLRFLFGMKLKRRQYEEQKMSAIA